MLFRTGWPFENLRALVGNLHECLLLQRPDGDGIALNQPNIARLCEHERVRACSISATARSSLDLPAPVRHHRRHGHAARLGVVGQVGHRARQRRRRRRQREQRWSRHRRRDCRQVGVRGTGTQEVSVFVEGRLQPWGRTTLLRSRASTCSTTRTRWAEASRPTATRARRFRRSGRSPACPLARRRLSRRSRISTLRGCSSSSSGTSSSRLTDREIG